MSSKRLTNLLLGVAVIFAGVGIILDHIGMMDFHLGQLFPFVMIYFGLRLLERGRRWLGAILLIWGVLLFLEIWLRIHMDDLIGLFMGLGMMYIGYRMIRSKRKEIELPLPNTQPSSMTSIHKEDEWLGKKAEEMKKEPNTEPARNGFSSQTYTMGSPEYKQSLIGNLFLNGNRWELRDMNIWHGIGEVKIDLSRAQIHDGESVIIISGWIGDIDIYVPYDLDITLIAHVNIGDIDVFGNKQGGLNRSVSLTTTNYHQSPKRVRMIVNLLVGDIDVTYV